MVDKANFGLTGALAKDTRTGNIYKGVVLKVCVGGVGGMGWMGWRMDGDRRVVGWRTLSAAI